MVAAPVPEPVQTERYCSILDIEFEINNDEMQREEKDKLKVLGVFLTKYPNTTAVIEGHIGQRRQGRGQHEVVAAPAPKTS